MIVPCVGSAVLMRAPFKGARRVSIRVSALGDMVYVSIWFRVYAVR